MATEVRVPVQGQSVEEVTIVEWFKQEGDEVQEGAPLYQIETDKAVFDIDAPGAGVLRKVFAKAGQEVPVLDLIAVIAAADEDISAIQPQSAPTSNAAEALPEPPSATQSEQQQPDPQPADKPAPPPIAEQPVSQTGRVAISPRARKLAQTEQVDYQSVSGSGPNGRIVERDLLPVIASRLPLAKFQSVSASASPQQLPAPKTIKVSGVRKIIAERMHAGMNETAPVTLNARADARAMQSLREHIKSAGETFGVGKLSYNDLIMYAVANLLPQFPRLNAHFSWKEIVEYPFVHLGFATDTDRGLVVPVVQNAEQLTLTQLAATVRELATGAREGKLSRAQITGSTFTVTNLGAFGVESFNPVLNLPEVAILGVGTIALAPIEENGYEQNIPMINLCLTFDHRAMDGADAARFLKTLSDAIKHFDLLLIQ